MPAAIQVWKTRDGKHFDVEAEARAHERENFAVLLVGLTTQEVEAALSRQDRDLADAIERAGTSIKAKRLGSGELRRARPDGNGGHVQSVAEANARGEVPELNYEESIALEKELAARPDAVSGPPWDDAEDEQEAV